MFLLYLQSAAMNSEHDQRAFRETRS